ncbi:MAG: hypothetical protein ACI906_004861 [Candidatus Latescibacterota bacterium]|jgi:hypothetical protein
MLDSITHITRQLSEMEEPHIRYKILLNVYRRAADSREIRIIRDEVCESALVSTLLAEQRREGHIDLPPHARWRGAHWVLHLLADMGCAQGDKRFFALRDQVCDWLLSAERQEPICGSIEGHALHYLHFLGLDDGRTDFIADRLVNWANAWNLGKTPASYAQALAALRGLTLHAQHNVEPALQQAATHLAEQLLDCGLYRKPGTETPISTDFTTLHYPCYEHADLLFALKVMAEADLAEDPRCRPAVESLKRKQLANGTFPAERKHYRVGRSDKEGDSLVNWGGTHRTRTNLFVTLDALSVLRAVGERF